MTLIEQLNAVIIAIAKDISNNSGGSSSGSSDNSDISVLLPRKFREKWYQSGLRYGADYPYPYVASYTAAVTGLQCFIPFTALEDATITGLEIYCITAQANSTISLGIYASDSNNDVAEPLFTSAPISCGTTGNKNAPCNVQITKGKVYWLSSLSIGSPKLQRIATDSLFSIKGSAFANYAGTIGYSTVNTSMTQSAPINKVDVVTDAPRVLFITG